jgi:ribA/ribD-fused uncharacterized protein
MVPEQGAILRFSGDYRFLSNFYPAAVQLDTSYYPTVEHAYQAAKVTDPAKRREIQAAPTPGIAKGLGRRVTLRPGWDTLRLGIMADLLEQKFSDLQLRNRLLATGQRALIEGNTWGDRYWGAVWQPKTGHPVWWEGENRLGKLLMELREAKR